MSSISQRKRTLFFAPDLQYHKVTRTKILSSIVSSFPIGMSEIVSMISFSNSMLQEFSVPDIALRIWTLLTQCYTSRIL